MSGYPGMAGLAEARPSLAGGGVVVTGGSCGIGYACAAEVLAAGGRVVLAARGAAALVEAVERLAGEYGAERVRGVVADIGVEGDVARLFGEAEGWLGSVTGVVHAAGVQGPIGPTAEVEAAAWLETLRVNLYGSYLVSAAAVRVMSVGRGVGVVAGSAVPGVISDADAVAGGPGERIRARTGGGSIVLLSGGGAATPFPRYTAYAASKAGVVRLAESLAVEVAPLGIRVNALAPGFVATRIHEATLSAGELAGGDYLRRTREQLAGGGVPAELAGRAAVFLLSAESAGITGRLLAAPWDRWWEWPERLSEGGDLFTLRRIVPRDRGGEWQ